MRLVAQWDFTARDADELSLKEGDIVSDAEPSENDPEWWWGRCGAAQGIFPRNYVDEVKGPELPPGWEAGDEDGDTYYFNRETQESVWDIADIPKPMTKQPSRPAGQQSSTNRSPRAGRTNLPEPNSTAAVINGRSMTVADNEDSAQYTENLLPANSGSPQMDRRLAESPSVEEERGPAQQVQLQNDPSNEDFGSLLPQQAAGNAPPLHTMAVAGPEDGFMDDGSNSEGAASSLPALQQANSTSPNMVQGMIANGGSGMGGSGNRSGNRMSSSSSSSSPVPRSILQTGGASGADAVSEAPATNQSFGQPQIDGETLKLIANLVDMRLTNEFRRRDAVISEMTTQMTRLREQLQAQVQKRQSQASEHDNIDDELSAHGMNQQHGSPGQRKQILPRIANNAQQQQQQQQQQKLPYRQQPQRQYEFDENLPRVAMLKARPSDYVDEREVEHNMAAKLAVRYPQCKSAVYPPSFEPAASSHRLKASLDIDHIHGYSGDWGRDPANQSRMNNALVLKTGEFVYPAAAVVVVLDPSRHQQRFYKGHSAEVTCVAKHPSGLVVASGPANIGASVHVWSAEGSDIDLLSEIDLGRRSKGVQALDFSPDGELLLCVDRDSHHSVTVWKWSNSECLVAGRCGNQSVFGMVFNPILYVPEEQVLDGGGASYALVSYGVRHIKYWTLHTEKDDTDWRHSWKLEGSLAVTGRSSDDFTSVAFIDDDPGDISLGIPPRGRIVAGTSNGALTVWSQLEDVVGEGPGMLENAEEKALSIRWQSRAKLIASIDSRAGAVQGLASVQSQGNQTLAVGCKDGSVSFWHVVRGQGAIQNPLERGEVIGIGNAAPGLGPSRSLDFSSGDAGPPRLLVGTLGNGLCSVDWARGNVEVIAQGHLGRVLAVAPHPSQPLYATVASDKSIRMWDLEERKMLAIAKLPVVGNCLSYHPEGNVVAVGSMVGEIMLMQFTIDTGAWTPVARRAVGPKSKEKAVKVHEDGSISVSPVKKQSNKHGVKDLRFSPDGSVLAVACKDSMVYLLDVNNNLKRLATLKGHSTWVSNLDFNFDGSVLQTVDGAKEILFWDVAKGTQISNAFKLRDEQWATWTCLLGYPVQGIWDEEGEHEYNTLCRSNEGSILACGGDTKAVRVTPFPCLDGSQSIMFPAHSASISAVRFMGDDSMLISVAPDSCVVQWNVQGIDKYANEDEEADGRE